MDATQTLILGVTDETLPLAGREAVRHATLALAGQAKRSIDILSRQLDPAVYDHDDLVEGVTRFCRRSPKARVRIIVQDPGSLRGATHRLVELAIKLSSSIEIRSPDTDAEQRNDAFLIADQTGTVYINPADRYEGKAVCNDRRYAYELLREFEEMWQHAVPDPNFRWLGI